MVEKDSQSIRIISQLFDKSEESEKSKNEKPSICCYSKSWTYVLGASVMYVLSNSRFFF